MLNKGLIVSSPTCERDKTQTSLLYLATALNDLGIEYDLLDLSGTINYFDPPSEFISPCDSEYWLSSRVFHEASWLDHYLPKDAVESDVVLYSALFSPDILLHGRHSLNQKKHYPETKTIIGGSAISCLNERQLSIIAEVFDYVCIGYDVMELIDGALKNSGSPENGHRLIKVSGPVKIQPDYKLLDINEFLTVYSGHGCNWGKCAFCNSANVSVPKYYVRPAGEIADDLKTISKLNGNIKDIMLSSDSFTKESLTDIGANLKQRSVKAPYNIMLRGERWVSKELGKLLSDSGCTDVFIGAESLNDEILKTINKGLNAEALTNAIRTLSDYVKIIVGLILFIPGATEEQLDDQLSSIENILPYVDSIEPEILSVVQGTAFAEHPEKYGIRLWATERNINDSWCYGLSPDIPWTFSNSGDAEIWFKYYDRLRNLTQDFVRPHYWDSIDYVRLRFQMGEIRSVV